MRLRGKEESRALCCVAPAAQLQRAASEPSSCSARSPRWLCGSRLPAAPHAELRAATRAPPASCPAPLRRAGPARAAAGARWCQRPALLRGLYAPIRALRRGCSFPFPFIFFVLTCSSEWDISKGENAKIGLPKMRSRLCE